MPAACYVQFPRSLPKRHLRSGRASVHRAKRSPNKCVFINYLLCNFNAGLWLGPDHATSWQHSKPRSSSEKAHWPSRPSRVLASSGARPAQTVPQKCVFYIIICSVISTWGCGLARTAPHRGSTWSRWLVANASVSNHTRQNRCACASRSCQLQRSAGADQT